MSNCYSRQETLDDSKIHGAIHHSFQRKSVSQKSTTDRYAITRVPLGDCLQCYNLSSSRPQVNIKPESQGVLSRLPIQGTKVWLSWRHGKMLFEHIQYIFFSQAL